MRIGILQTGAAPDALKGTMGDYPDFFERLLTDQGFDFKRYTVMEMEFPTSVHDCDGWLITGSRFGVYEEHAFIAPLEAFIRDAYAARVPVVGICFGHQIMAQAMGGRVEKYTGGWSVGPTDYRFGDEVMTLNAWHQDQVVEKPASAEVIACTDFCTNAGLLYGDTMLSVQPHPEFSKEFMEGLITFRGPGLVAQPILEAATARIEAPLATHVMSRKIADFFRQPRNKES